MRETKGCVWPKPVETSGYYAGYWICPKCFCAGVHSVFGDFCTACGNAERGLNRVGDDMFLEAGIFLNRMDQLRPDKSRAVLTDITA